MSLQLKRNQMKYFSSDNMRLLSSLILSLSSKQSAMEDKLIDYWTPSTAYIKDESMVIYDDAIQICKISNADAVFDQNKWLKLSPEITELTKDDISALINLSPEEISKLSDLISTEIRLDKVFSSSDTYMRIQAAIDTAKEYTNNQLGKAVKPAYKVVSSTSEVTETGYFYLISNGTNYDMYVLSADGSVVSLGTSDVDLSDYAKLTDLDNYYDKSTSDGKFATITTVDGKVDKTSILTTTSTTATDEQVYSANVVNKSISNQGIYSGDVNEIPMIKPDVLYSYSVRYESCTNLPNLCGHGILENMYLGSTDYATQRLTAINTKTVYMRVKGGGTWGDWIKLSTAEDKMVKVNGDVLEYIKNNPQKNLTIFWDTTDTNTPYTAGFTGSGGGTLISNVFDGKWGSVIGTCGGDFFCINRLMGGTWQGWEKLCVTKVKDVPTTIITDKLTSTKVAFPNPDSYATFYVKNGTCYVTIWSMKILETCSVEVIFKELPKSAVGVTTPLCNGQETFAQIFMSPNGSHIAINADASLIGKNGYCSFSYPVAEE